MRTFTKQQIEQIKAVLANSNVRLVAAKSQIRDELSERETRVRAWKPLTSDGSRCKSAMLRTIARIRQFGYGNEWRGSCSNTK